MGTLIRLDNVRKAFGSTVILDGAGLDLADGERVGVIGRNGAGKTTLLRLILGEEELDGGEIISSGGLRLGHLEQRSPFLADETALAFLLRRSGRPEWECARLAAAFHVAGELLETQVGELPGGYQTRLKLVAMLLVEPNVLLLDEPTNYLDLRTLLLLERFLAGFSGGALIVSHDREFLRRTCSKTLEVGNGRLTLFPGDVEAYLVFREEQHERVVRENRNIEAQRRHIQRFIDRARVNKKTAGRVQARIKQLEKLRPIEIDHPMKTATIRIPAVEVRPGLALRCEDLAIGYPGKTVAAGVRFEIDRGERVAVLGDNGEGKTTFLRTVAGDLAPLAGDFRWGHGLAPGYYAQHVYTALPEDRSVLEHLRDEAPADVLDQDVLDMAGCFLFSGDDAHKPIGVLSGGERARVCLAGLLLARRPVLLLDEPTNHLDFETVEALGRALREHRGTLFFVSHDRAFIELVATHIVEVRGGAVTLYPGDYEAYVYQARRELGVEQPEPAAAAAVTPRGEAPSTDYHRRKELRSTLNRLRRRVAESEERLAALEEEKAAIHRHFIENPMDAAPEKQERLRELDDLIAAEEERWLALHEDLDAL